MKILVFLSSEDKYTYMNNKWYSHILDGICQQKINDKNTVIQVFHPFVKKKSVSFFLNPREFDIYFHIARAINYLTRKLLFINFDFFYLVYKFIIKKHNPDLIITIGSPVSLCKASHQLGISLHEYIHGFGYSFIPWDYDKRLPAELPDKLYVFDDISLKTFRKDRYLNHLTEKTKYIDISLESKNNDLFKKLLKKSKKYKFVLIYSVCWGYKGDNRGHNYFDNLLDNGVYPNWFEKFLQNNSELLFLIKYHPAHLNDRSKYHEIFETIELLNSKYPNVDIDLPNRLSTIELSKVIDAHLTMRSMFIYDLSFYSVPSITMCPTILNNPKFLSFGSDLVERGLLYKTDLSYESFISLSKKIGIEVKT